MREKKVSVILLSMGGPDTISAIRPFLFNLFRDRDIIPIPGGPVVQTLFAYVVSGIRARKVRPLYEQIGGGSPIASITEAQARKLELFLNEEGPCRFTTHVGMRYWYPFVKHAVSEVREEKPDLLVALSLYPHYSRTTTGSSLRELKRCLERWKVDVPLRVVREYPDHPGYIASLREKILPLVKESSPERTAIVFSAHGLPKGLIAAGDPYLSQVETTVKRVMDDFPGFPWYLSFQSRLGRDWLEPDTEEVIRLARRSEFEKVVLVPVSFVCDHIETLYEVDIYYRQVAEEEGLEFARAGV
ncbi:MAG: ferrochelatase, partial [Deltaproteobacteria bacterium]